ncbi:Ankyrin-2 [Symbiodinium microadriaticum]|uniref:Ankyrin-2 n=1 Tax=Symbiodinium microadriaticum TaxID=2951 RepID=A0A1Q9F711_SYMMI|nr:Ankyrin-2 [Symbiodinium microadriaticum]
MPNWSSYWEKTWKSAKALDVKLADGLEKISAECLEKAFEELKMEMEQHECTIWLDLNLSNHPTITDDVMERQKLLFLNAHDKRKEDDNDFMVLDDERTLRPGEVQVVLLSFCPASKKEVKALLTAADSGRAAAVESILCSPQDPDLVLRLPALTALFVASERGHLEVTRLVLEANADTEKALEDGATPLYLAAQSGQLEVVRLLLQAGAAKDKAKQNGATPLFVAAQKGHLEVVSLLLNFSADKDKAKQNGATPLFLAAGHGHLEVVSLLLEFSADTEKALEGGGATPLYLAAQNGQLEVVRLLLQASADKDKAKQNGATPWFVAAERGHLEVASLLLEFGATPLCIAA